MALISLKRLSDGVTFQIEESNILLVFASSTGVVIEHRDTVNGNKDTVEVSNAIAEIVSISERLMLIHYSDNSPSIDLYIDHNRITDVYLEGSYASVIYNKGNNEVVNLKTVDSVATILTAVYTKKGYFNYAVDIYSGDTIRLAAAAGDVTAKFTNGKVITVYGALAENNDTYVVDSSTYGGGKTTITLAVGTGVSDDADTTGRVMIKNMTTAELETEVQDITDGTSSFDTISELTSGAGVTVDGVLLKDSQVTTDQINEKTGAVGVTIDGVLLKDSQVTTDVINEKTATAGVTLDSVLLKDGLVKTSAGAVGLPAVQIGATDTGFYQVSGTQTGMAQDGALVAVFDSLGMTAESIRHRVNLGTTPVGTVSISEESTGRDVTTVLTLTNFIVGGLAGAAAALGVGNIVYAYPAGQHLELVSSFSSLVLTAAGTAVVTDTGLGSVIATGAVAVLSGTATFEDRLTGQAITTNAVGGAAVSALTAATAGIGTGISLNVAGSVKNVFLNSAGTWNVDNVGNLTCSGLIVLKWTKMS